MSRNKDESTAMTESEIVDVLRTLSAKKVVSAQRYFESGYNFDNIFKHTGIPVDVVRALSLTRKWVRRNYKFKDQSRLQPPVPKMDDVKEACDLDPKISLPLNTMSRMSQLRRQYPNFKSLYQNKGEATKNVIYDLISKGKTVQSAFGAFGFFPVGVKKWYNEDPEFELYILHAISVYQENVMKFIEEAAKQDWRAAAWIHEHHPNIRGAFKEEKDPDSGKISITFKRDAGLHETQQLAQGVTLDMEVDR